MKCIKNQGKRVTAYRLERGNAGVVALIEAGKISTADGQTFEIRTQEAQIHGEIASAGDYIKLDAEGFPYPNDRAFFESSHTHVQGDEYLQNPKPLEAWSAEEPRNDIVAFLLRSGRLHIQQDCPEAYFSAELWGTTEVAARDAVVVFYSVTRGADGTVTDVDFNLVKRSVFDQTYHIID